MIRRLMLVLSLLVIGLIASGQPMVTVQVSKDTIEVGEELTMTVSIVDNQPLGKLQVDYSPLGEIENLAMKQDTTPVQTEPIEIEWLQSPFADADETVLHETSRDSTGKYSLRETFRFRVWDFGAFQMPAPIYMNSDKSDTLEVRKVQYPVLWVPFPSEGIPQDTTQMINPIEPIVRELRNWKDFLWLIIMIAVIGAIVLLVFFQSRRKKKDLDLDYEHVEEVKPKRPAHIIALEQLNKLKQERTWESGHIKEYQSKLTFAIREYLENRFEIQALESTTSEIVTDLEGKDFDQSYNSSLTRILQVADLVKFAKATPDDNMHEEFLDEAIAFVDDTKSVEEIEETDGSE